jgi:hypothetical protein
VTDKNFASKDRAANLEIYKGFWPVKQALEDSLKDFRPLPIAKIGTTVGIFLEIQQKWKNKWLPAH